MSAPEDFHRLRTDRETGQLRVMTDDEIIEHALSWLVDFTVHRDTMNAAVHTGQVRPSPVTELAIFAHAIAKGRIGK